MAIHAVSQNVGQLFAIAISCVIFAENLRKHLYWRWVIALSSVPAFLHMFMLFWYPKSPRWLIQKNKTHQAIGVLTQILGRFFVCFLLLLLLLLCMFCDTFAHTQKTKIINTQKELTKTKHDIGLLALLKHIDKYHSQI